MLPAGQPVTGTGDIGNLLRPADFGAVGLSGAGAPSINTSGGDSFCIVYAGVSGAGGGLELDVFLYATAADAAGDFGDVGLYAVDPAQVQGAVLPG
jgi:hypothetical protein